MATVLPSTSPSRAATTLSTIRRRWRSFARIDASIDRLRRLNLDIWQTVATFGYPL